MIPGLAGEALAQAVQHPAEGMFAVRGTHAAIEIQLFLFDPFQLAVMRKGPVLAPQHAHEGVGILETDPAAVRLAKMTDDDVALDRIAPDEFCDLGAGAGAWVMEAAAAPALVGCACPTGTTVG